MGWGLWLLSELVRVTRGSLWLWSGNAAYGFGSDGTSRVDHTPITWSGVAIEITLYPDQAAGFFSDSSSARLKALAKELSL